MQVRLKGGRLLLTGHAFHHEASEHPGGWQETLRRGCCKKRSESKQRGPTTYHLVDETELLAFKNGAFEAIEDNVGCG